MLEYLDHLKDFNHQYTVVLSLGGTISSKAVSTNDEFYSASNNNLFLLIDAMNLEPLAVKIAYKDLYNKISQDLSVNEIIDICKTIKKISEYKYVKGIVITAGTNTLEEIAYFASLTIHSYKPIVFTGAFRPQNSLDFDGEKNLYNAILIASQLNEPLGVVVTFSDCIVQAKHASKMNPSVIGYFADSDNNIAGFIADNKIHLKTVAVTHTSTFNINTINKLPLVAIVYAHMGLHPAFIESMIAHGVQGIISAGFGKGYQSKEITQALKKASDQGTVVVRCSRSGQGIVNRDPKLDIPNRFVAGGSLNPQKALIFLSLALTKTIDVDEIQSIFELY